MKMYILIKETVPINFAILSASHASLAGYLKFKDTDEVDEWLSGPFYKVVCKVSEKEFENAKKYEDHVIITESALDNTETAIVFKPREEYPKGFKFYKLYK